MKPSKLQATLDSRNFFVSLISVAMLMLSYQGVAIDVDPQAVADILLRADVLGIVFPDGAAAAVVEAIFSGGTGAIATALVVNLLNPLYHFLFDRPKAT